MPIDKDGLGFLVADVNRLLRRAFQKRLHNSALTLAQARALIYVSRHEGIRQVELAELLDVQPITLTRLIDQLEHSRLVERRPDPTDRRAFRVFATSAAAAHLEAIDTVICEILSDATAGISTTATARTKDALTRMRANLTGTA